MGPRRPDGAARAAAPRTVRAVEPRTVRAAAPRGTATRPGTPPPVRPPRLPAVPRLPRRAAAECLTATVLLLWPSVDRYAGVGAPATVLVAVLLALAARWAPPTRPGGPRRVPPTPRRRAAAAAVLTTVAAVLGASEPREPPHAPAPAVRTTAV